MTKDDEVEAASPAELTSRAKEREWPVQGA